jgi:3-hydroxyacyl-[acyl-carrier-protein] dehydratase
MEREAGPAAPAVAGRSPPGGPQGLPEPDGSKATLEAVDIQRLLELLPHRYPFLMIDRIVDIDGANSAVGIKNVSVNEPQFAGHFPGRPIMPGVLMLEGMAQTAGAIAIRAAARAVPPIGFLMGIDDARFRKLVIPGDVVEYHVTKKRAHGAVWKFACEARVGGSVVAEAVITAMVATD